MYISARNNGIIYDGPAGIAFTFSFNYWEEPSGRIQSESFSTRMDWENAAKLARMIADGKFKFVSAPINEVYFDSDHRLNTTLKACIVITNEDFPSAFTNIENKDLFAMLLSSIITTILSNAQKEEPPVVDVDEDETICYPDNAMMEILLNELKEHKKAIRENEKTIKRCMSVRLFVDGMAAITCSSKGNYTSMMKFLAKNNVILTKSVNKEGWNDVCKFVYCERMKEGNRNIFVAHAHFRMPDTIDRVVSFNRFKKELITINECVRDTEESKVRMKEIQVEVQNLIAEQQANEQGSGNP